MTTEERQRLWATVYALHSFEEAGKTVSLMLDNCPDNRCPLYLPLAIAAHAQYCRPFNRMDGIDRRFRFTDADVPKEMQGHHKFMTTFRDQAFVHTDANTQDLGAQLHDVFVEIQPDGPRFEWVGPSPRSSAYEEIPPLIQAMRSKAAERLLSFGAILKTHLPTPGQYRLLLKGDQPFELA